MEIKVSVEELRKAKLFLATPMYSGVCHGMYTRSLTDLSSFFTRHNIELQFYFMFNESLITRARNYIADEFMRSDCTHLMFIDSDIVFNSQDVVAMLALSLQNDDYHVLCGPYPKKCLHRSCKILTEDGYKTVNDIVVNQYSGLVYGFDERGKKVAKRVTNWWKEKNTQNKKWLSVRTSTKRSRNTITVTSDHEVAVVEDILDPKISFVPAKNLVGQHMVTNPTKNNNRKYNALYTKQQISALVGMSLGDGCLSGGCFAIVHGPQQSAYATHKAELLDANIIDDRKFTKTNAQTIHLSKLIGAGNNKTLEHVLHLIDEVSLAYLYMDDGNLFNPAAYYKQAEITDKTWWYNVNTQDTKRGTNKPSGEGWRLGRKGRLNNTCTIGTMGLSVEDNFRLRDHIKEKFNIVCDVMFQSPNVHGEKYPFLRFDNDNTIKFHELIAPYIHESMEYKLVEECKGKEKHKIDITPLEYGAILVTEVVEVETDSSLYDIEVEDIHNFITNDILVHNCISFEKIKAAVDKGVADEDPSVLENYVGDYVFNPKNGSTEMSLGEPVEIMEGGTGFMLIKREVFEEYDKHFPQLKYKPDHVRTEHFDGSREIMAYFDAIIDDKNQFIADEIAEFYEQNPKATKDEVIEFLKDKRNGLVNQYSNRYLSEDYMFCHNVQRMGMKVWLCPWIALKHCGTYVFGGSLAHLASIGASATADPAQLKKGKKR